MESIELLYENLQKKDKIKKLEKKETELSDLQEIKKFFSTNYSV